jgi:hypothetical protein
MTEHFSAHVIAFGQKTDTVPERVSCGNGTVLTSNPICLSHHETFSVTASVNNGATPLDYSIVYNAAVSHDGMNQADGKLLNPIWGPDTTVKLNSTTATYVSAVVTSPSDYIRLKFTNNAGAIPATENIADKTASLGVHVRVILL